MGVDSYPAPMNPLPTVKLTIFRARQSGCSTHRLCPEVELHEEEKRLMAQKQANSFANVQENEGQGGFDWPGGRLLSFKGGFLLDGLVVVGSTTQKYFGRPSSRGKTKTSVENFAKGLKGLCFLDLVPLRDRISYDVLFAATGAARQNKDFAQTPLS